MELKLVSYICFQLNLYMNHVLEAGNLVTNDDLAKHLVKTINKEFEKRDLLFKVQVVPDERYSNESLFIWVSCWFIFCNNVVLDKFNKI